MKRKMALLLAGIMTVASLPINTFAQSPTLFRPASTYLSRSPLPAPNRTAFVEQGAGPAGQVSGDVTGNDRVNHWIEGGNLIIELPNLQENFTTNGPVQFDLELQNAEWFFRNVGDPNTAGLGFATYNTSNGTWNQANGTYTRQVSEGRERNYTMQVFSGDPRRATLTLSELATGNTQVNNSVENNNTSNNNTVNNNNVEDNVDENNNVDNGNTNNSNDEEMLATSANVVPESKPEEKKIEENKPVDKKRLENKTEENKTQENKATEIKKPEIKTTNNEKAGTELPEKELKTKEKVTSKEQSQEKLENKTKENKVETSVKPANEAPVKETPANEAPAKVTPKTAAVAVASIAVDAISPADDIGFTRNAGANDGYQHIRDAHGQVADAVNDISTAIAQTSSGNGTVGGVRGPVEGADGKIREAQGFLADETPVSTVNSDLSNAVAALGQATDALDAMEGDDTQDLETGANFDALTTALTNASNAAISARTALSNALPAAPGNGNGNVGGNVIRSGDIISIPLAVRTTGENEDSSIRVRTGNPIPVETDRRIFALGRQEGLTTTVVSNPRTGRDRVEIPSIGILENRIGAFPESGTFEIVAPSGYRFANLPADAALRPEGGIGAGTNFTQSLRLRDNNNRILEVTYSNLARSTRLTGSFAITGLTLVSDNPESIREGDIFLEIRNVGNPQVVTSQRFLAGRAADWRVAMTVIGDAPQLVNGRLYGVEKTDVNDQAHRAARVRVEENVENAWWAQRTTTFTLPEQVRVRKVEFNNIRNISNYNELNGSFYNDRNRSGSANVRVNDNVITLSNLQTSNTGRASFEMDLWLNIESGFTGNIPLVLGGAGINNGNNTNNDQSVVIATAINPVRLNVDVTNVRLGYQFVPVGNFSIIETAPGALRQGEQVFLTITDNVSNDVTIASGFDWNVATGDLRIRNIRTGSNLSLNNNNNNNRNNVNVSFEIDRESSQASEIQFSNVQVRLGNNVAGSGSHDYDLVVWGPAIAANFEGVRPDNDRDLETINRNDFFREAGIRAKYITVQSTANNILSNVVRATAGNPVIMINDTPHQMDTAPYISPESDSMMVPVRFISMGLGVEPNRVLWSPDTSTVTIDAGQRILQFQTNSSMMRINGIEIPMLNANGQPVYSEVRDERAFIPMRALGEALNVHVSWEPATATATFDPTRTPERGQTFSVAQNDNTADYGNYNSTNNNTNNTNTNTNQNNGATTNSASYQNGTNGYTNGNENGTNDMNQSDTRYQGTQVRSRGLFNRAGMVQQSRPVNNNTIVNR